MLICKFSSFNTKTFSIAFLVFLLLLCTVSFQAHCQTDSDELLPRVYIHPIENLSDSRQCDTICAEVYRTLFFNLELIGSYHIIQELPEEATVEEDALQPEQMTIEQLNTIAEQHSLDNIIFGELTEDENGIMHFSISVFSAADSEISITEEAEIHDIFDIFDEVDRTTISLMETFSGIHIGYGNIELEHTDRAGDFWVELNNMRIVENQDAIDDVLNGDYTINIFQNRFGETQRIYSEDITVVEDETATIRFSIPYLLPEEETRIEEITRIYHSPAEDLASFETGVNRFGEAEQLFADISFCPDLIQEKNEIFSRMGRWASNSLMLLSSTHADSIREVSIEEAVSIFSAVEAPRDSEDFQLQAAAVDYYCYILTLHAAEQWRSNELELVQSTYEQISRWAPYCSPAMLGQLNLERDLIDAIFEDYQEDRENRPGPLLPILGSLAGAGLSGYSAYEFVLDPSSDIANAAAAQYEEYQGATDPAQLETMHNDIFWSYLSANALEIGKWVGAVTGPLLITWSGWSAFSSATQPRTRLNNRLKNIWEERTDVSREIHHTRNGMPPQELWEHFADFLNSNTNERGLINTENWFQG
ncbi:MAG: hypothetical protein ACLFR1_12285 [Spirochaetia bacterium]